MKRGVTGEVRGGLGERHPGRLGQRDQGHLLLQPLDLGLGMRATPPSGKNLDLPSQATTNATRCKMRQAGTPPEASMTVISAAQWASRDDHGGHHMPSPFLPGGPSEARRPSGTGPPARDRRHPPRPGGTPIPERERSPSRRTGRCPARPEPHAPRPPPRPGTHRRPADHFDHRADLHLTGRVLKRGEDKHQRAGAGRHRVVKPARLSREQPNPRLHDRLASNHGSGPSIVTSLMYGRYSLRSKYAGPSPASMMGSPNRFSRSAPIRPY